VKSKKLVKLGSLRAHPPIVFLRYTLHVFSHTVDLLSHHTSLVLFIFLFFCIALCTNGEKSAWGANFA
uniref:Uncharacterized protein n=1 Tax=Anas zonorhyncha TaxID=75864 RepID=A0A8B9VFA2_9AVES